MLLVDTFHQWFLNRSESLAFCKVLTTGFLPVFSKHTRLNLIQWEPSNLEIMCCF